MRIERKNAGTRPQDRKQCSNAGAAARELLHSARLWTVRSWFSSASVVCFWSWICVSSLPFSRANCVRDDTARGHEISDQCTLRPRLRAEDEAKGTRKVGRRVNGGPGRRHARPPPPCPPPRARCSSRPSASAGRASRSRTPPPTACAPCWTVCVWPQLQPPDKGGQNRYSGDTHRHHSCVTAAQCASKGSKDRSRPGAACSRRRKRASDALRSSAAAWLRSCSTSSLRDRLFASAVSLRSCE